MKKLFSVLTDDMEHCIITGDSNIAIHHVFNGPNRRLSEKYGFLVPLRPDWHNMTSYSIHMDQRFDESMKRKAQRYYEEHYGDREDMLVHIVSPTRVRLLSRLDEERNREVLFETNAEVSEFQFDKWYDQERFMIEMQANFEESEDRALILKMAGNVERKNEQSFTDNGTDQVVTMQVGVASKKDVLVPNPVTLFPFRTFQEVEQPSSKFVFRIGDKEQPAFKIVEAENGIWKNEAISNIKAFLAANIAEMPEEIQKRITIIG